MARRLLTGALAILLAFQARAAAAQSVSFAPRANYPGGSTPQASAVGDLNGDGKPDLVWTNYGLSSNTVSVALGTGSGTFGARTDYSVGTNPISVSIGDVNGDGRPDLVVANWSSANVSVLLGTGGGAFAPKTNYSTGPGRPISGILADLDGDGDLDILVSDWSANSVRRLLNNGAGVFGAPFAYPAGSLPYSIALADLSGDGRRDVVVANRSTTQISVLLGLAGGGFASPSAFTVGSDPIAVALGDVNGDGKLDVAVANFASSNVSVLLGNGVGGFAAKTDYPVGTAPRSVWLADVDMDGKLDIVVTDVSGNVVSVLSGNGAGAFAPRVNFATAAGPAMFTVADLNADGRPDLVVACGNADSVSVLLNNTAPVGVPSPGSSTCPTLVRLGPDGSCCFDVLVRDVANNPVPGAAVTIDFGPCAMSFSPTQPPGLVINVAANTARLFTDATGLAHFCINATSSSPSCHTTVSANGVLLCSAVPIQVCAPDTVCTPGAWKLVSSTGPSLRYGNAMASITNHYSVVMFGGVGAGNTLLGDTWVWDGLVWTQKSPLHHPTPRWGHAMAYDYFRDRVVLFGGFDASGAEGDTWEWDGTDWSQVSTTGPAARHEHGLAYDLDKKLTYLYGGSPLRSDMWQWDGSTWTQVCSACAPGPRERATMSYDIGRGRTFLFGGVGSGGATDVTQWVWDGADWAQIPAESSRPLPASARDQSSTYANSCNAVVMFGGETGGDTWSWLGAHWFRSPTAQPQRVRYALSYDLFQDRPVMFGGYDPALGPTSLSTGTWEWCSPCSTPLLPTDSLGHGIYPSDDGVVADDDTAEVIQSGFVSDLYPGYDTSTNAWMSQYPCDFTFGGDEDPADEDENPQAELDSLGFTLTPAALQDSMTAWNARIGATYNAQPRPPLGAVGLPYHFPDVPHCPDTGPGHRYVFGGRDIIYIHGFRTDPLKAALLNTHTPNAIDTARVGWNMPTKFPGNIENPDFYGNGYWKLGAERYWRHHVKHFLTDRGNQNRYLIVAWPVTQRLDVAIQCVLTQIADAMQYGIGVVDPSGHHDCSNFGTPNFVVVSHSTGGLLTSAMMRAAEDTQKWPNLNASYIPKLCKGEVALNGAITGSNEALALAVVAGVAGPVVPQLGPLCMIVNTALKMKRELLPDKCPTIPCVDEPVDQDLPCSNLSSLDLSYIYNGVTIDLIPSVARGTWGPVKDLSPIRTVTMGGGHPTTYGNVVKHHILMGLDDGVVALQNACANPESLTTANAYWGRKRDIKDKWLKYMGMTGRAKGYFRDQWKDDHSGSTPGFRLVNIGANENIAPWGMKQPDHDAASSIYVSPAFGDPYYMLGHDPTKRLHNHFSFMESASDHYGTTPSWDDCPPFTGPNGVFYEWTGSCPDTIEANSEETLAITDDHVYDHFSMPHYPDDAPMLKKDLPREVEEVDGVAKKRKKNGKTVYKWTRTYRRAEGWQTKVLGDYMYECVLTDPVPACTPVCCVRPPSGMLAWYTGEVGADVNQANATFDAVQPRAEGVLTSGALLTPGGKVGSGFSLDGVNDYVHVPDKLKLRLGAQFTVSAWVYARDTTEAGQIILDKGTWTTFSSYGLHLNHGRPELIIRTPGCVQSILADQVPALADSCWHHIVATRQLSAAKIYVDGVLVATGTITCTGSLASAQPLEIGGRAGDPASCFAGLIDEVVLWNRALNGTEIESLWEAGSEGMCRETWWVPSVLYTNNGQASFKPVICNFTRSNITAHYQFVATAAGGACTAAGPTNFNPAGGSQTIIPGGCAILPIVTATLPAGMSVGASSCYQMQTWFRESERSACYQIAKGRIVKGLPIWDVGSATATALLIPSDVMAASVQVRFDVHNLSATAQALPYRITIVPSDGDTTGMAILTLNNLAPQDPVVGSVNVPAGGTVQVSVNIGAASFVADRYYDLVFAYDMDGDNVPDAAAAIGLGDFEDQEFVGVPPEPSANIETLRWVHANPNPFTDRSTIEFDLATPGWAEVEIYDIAGRKLRDLSQAMTVAGHQRVTWDGRDDQGRVAVSGVYMVRVRALDRATTAKVLLVRQRR